MATVVDWAVDIAQSDGFQSLLGRMVQKGTLIRKEGRYGPQRQRIRPSALLIGLVALAEHVMGAFRCIDTQGKPTP